MYAIESAFISLTHDDFNALEKTFKISFKFFKHFGFSEKLFTVKGEAVCISFKPVAVGFLGVKGIFAFGYFIWKFVDIFRTLRKHCFIVGNNIFESGFLWRTGFHGIFNGFHSCGDFADWRWGGHVRNSCISGIFGKFGNLRIDSVKLWRSFVFFIFEWI